MFVPLSPPWMRAISQQSMGRVGRHHPGGRSASSGRRLRSHTTPSVQDAPASPPDLLCCGSATFKHSDVVLLCNGLFDYLRDQLEHVLSGALFSPPAASSDIKVSPKGFLQLLRCCFIMMDFMIPISELKSLSVEKGLVLVEILRKLCPPNSYSRLSGERVGSGAAVNAANSEGGAPASFLCAILEVSIHELLMHQQIRKHLAEIDCDSAITEKLFASHESCDHINTVLELVSSHFLLSNHDELSFSKFMHSLSWSVKVDNEIPEVGLGAALTLLGHPFMFSAPYMLQSHLILLTARCIGIHMPTCDRKSDDLALNHLLAAFELSVKLYRVYMSDSDFLDNFIGSENQSSSVMEIPFDSCIRRFTCDELNHQISKLVNFCYKNSHGVLSEIKADIVNGSCTYITENQHVIDELIKDGTFLILNYIILNVLPGETENTVKENGKQIREEIYCLAAVMKLMSSSLLHILWHLKRNGFAVGGKALKGQPLHKEYDFLSVVISCLGKYGASRAIQEALLHVMETHDTFTERKLILTHFASLLSYSFRKRHGFLWKSCIFMMMVIMNLFLFEDGNLDAFQPLLNKVESVPRNSIANTPKISVSRKSSITIASSFQNIQKLYLKEQVKLLAYENQRMDRGDSNGTRMQDEQLGAPSCNGEAFLASLPGYRTTPSDFDDLVDFIECTPGKDYFEYLRNRSKFWWWRQKKRARRRKKIMEGGRKVTQVVEKMKMVLKGVRKRRDRKAMKGVGKHTPKVQSDCPGRSS